MNINGEDEEEAIQEKVLKTQKNAHQHSCPADAQQVQTKEEMESMRVKTTKLSTFELYIRTEEKEEG